jgi:hypothetical protein
MSPDLSAHRQGQHQPDKSQVGFSETTIAIRSSRSEILPPIFGPLGEA